MAISHHSLNQERDQVTSEKPLVFVLEPPKQDDEADSGKKRKKKNKDKAMVTANSFGNGLSISKFKGNSTFITGFRCRPYVLNVFGPQL